MRGMHVFLLSCRWRVTFLACGSAYDSRAVPADAFASQLWADQGGVDISSPPASRGGGGHICGCVPPSGQYGQPGPERLAAEPNTRTVIKFGRPIDATNG